MTGIRIRIDEVPAVISVESKDDIQLGQQQNDHGESLAAIPSLFIQDQYSFAQDLSIAIRGVGARSNSGIRGIKIVVDGVPESLSDEQGQSDDIVAPNAPKKGTAVVYISSQWRHECYFAPNTS